jgi:hypothetical protein
MRHAALACVHAAPKPTMYVFLLLVTPITPCNLLPQTMKRYHAVPVLHAVMNACTGPCLCGLFPCLPRTQRLPYM